MSGPDWILQKELPKARRSRQNVLRNMSSSLWRGIKRDQAPLLIRRTQRKGMRWHQAPLLIRRTQGMQQRTMKEVYMCCSKFLFQLMLMYPLFEINYHTLPYSKTIEKKLTSTYASKVSMVIIVKSVFKWRHCGDIQCSKTMKRQPLVGVNAFDV